jgi:hypothetical protein
VITSMVNNNGFRNGNGADKFTLLVSNIARLVGIGIAASEVFGRAEIRGSALAISALFFAGAQGLETFLQGGKK